jgi:uncharacterized DUF497 family protein
MSPSRFHEQHTLLNPKEKTGMCSRANLIIRFGIEKDIDKSNIFLNNKHMEIIWFEWDDNNIEHIARHNVTPDEVEDIAFDDEPWIRKGREGTRYMLGYTVAGRYLFTVYTLTSKGVARVITAMDMDEKTRKLYRKRGKS